MFAKVFAQVFDSSIAEDYRVRLVFEDFLKLADKDGVVDMTREAIARRTNVPLKIVAHGIAELEKPDKESRSPDCEGRRLVRLDAHRDWGWRIVNFQKYRESATKEMLRMGDAERKRESRRRKGFPPRPPIPKKKKNSEAEAEAEREADLSGLGPDMSRTQTGQIPTLEAVKLCVSKAGLPESDAEWFWNKCQGNGWTVNGKKIRSWPHVIGAWKAAGYMASQKNGAPTKTNVDHKELKENIEIREL